jgi:hypothetical protein
MIYLRISDYNRQHSWNFVLPRQAARYCRKR